MKLCRSAGTGSDAGNLATRAVRDGGDFVINGSKMFITNGTWADVVLLFARSTDAPGHRGVSAFLVPTDTPGLTRRTVHGKLGLRGQATAELVLQDVRVPASALLGEEGRGFKIAMSALAKGRMSVAAGCVGIAQAALDAAVAGARTWRSTPGHERMRILLQAATLADERAEAVAQTISAESGKSITEARGEASRSGEMIRVGLVTDRLQGRTRWWFEMFSLVIGLCFVGFFAWHAVQLTYDSWRFSDMAQGVLAIPLWIPQIGYATGLVILFIAFLDEFDDQAAALGWTTAELFGVHPTAGFIRVD